MGNHLWCGFGDDRHSVNPKILILILLLSGCASGPQIGDWDSCHGKANPEDMALIRHWEDQLESGDITISEFRFLVDGRIQAR